MNKQSQVWLLYCLQPKRSMQVLSRCFLRMELIFGSKVVITRIQFYTLQWKKETYRRLILFWTIARLSWQMQKQGSFFILKISKVSIFFSLHSTNATKTRETQTEYKFSINSVSKMRNSNKKLMTISSLFWNQKRINSNPQAINN